jgi:hypothetical protein
MISDTIIIPINQDHPGPDGYRGEVEYLSYIVADIFLNGLANQLLFRGAIAYGDVYEENSIILGPGIDEAVSWYEQSDWAGVHMTPSMENWIKYVGKYVSIDEAPSFLIEYDVPLKEDKTIRTHVINWPLYFIYSLEEEHHDNPYEELENMVRDVLISGCITPGIEAKYENTHSFYRYFLENRHSGSSLE